MFIRLLTWTGATDVDGGLNYLRDTVQPIIRQQNGYRGMSASVDRTAGVFTILSMWETDADREASNSALSKARDEGSQIIGGALTVEKLEEVASEVVQVPSPGAALMVSPYTIDPATIDDNLAFFRNEVVPQIKAGPGMCAFRNMVNRSTGEGYVGTIWADKAAMKVQAESAKARREMASGRGITFGTISYREILLIDNP